MNNPENSSDDFRNHEQQVQDALNHFGITEEDIEKSNGFTICDNNERTRGCSGIQYWTRKGAGGENEIEKARIVIDYDAGYSKIVIRVIAE